MRRMRAERETRGGGASLLEEQVSTTKQQQKPIAFTPPEEIERYKGITGWIRKKHYQYEVTIGLYMLDPWEKYLFSKRYMKSSVAGVTLLEIMLICCCFACNADSVALSITAGITYYGCQYIQTIIG